MWLEHLGTSLLGHILAKPPVLGDLGRCVSPSFTGALGKDVPSGLLGLQPVAVGPIWGLSHSLSTHAVPLWTPLGCGPQTLP